jgi:hypothetical protein
MCLLVEQPSTTSFSDEFLADVYSKNKDGLGIMYAEAGHVIVKKTLPKNVGEFIEFYRQYAEGRACIWHARMQTHGDIDLDNCHPYFITSRIWMAHNGILSTGNANDKSKSDTWHFIHHILQPVLAYEPDRILDPTYQNFLGSMIGSTNKFGFMTANGDSVIINRSAGVEYNGAWLSNTYAWSPSRFGVKTTSSGSYGGRWYTDYDSYDWDAGYSYTRGSLQTAKATGATVKSDNKQTIKPIIKAAYNSWLNNNLERWVMDAPWKASALLAYCLEDEDGAYDIVADDPATAAEWIYELFENEGLTPFNIPSA